MNIDLAQIDIVLGDRDQNIEKAIGIIESSNADLILFPELFTTGFDFGHLKKLSDVLPGETTESISAVCGGSIVGGTILEKADNNLYNTFVLISKDGVLAKYRKIHLFGDEKKYFTTGNKIKIVETPIGKTALATCYDIRFPELFREFVRQMPEMVLISAEFPDPREDHWKTLLRARAIENQCFVIATNRVGKDAKQSYFGASMVVDPWGKIIASAGREESILNVEIDLTRTEVVRSSFPVLEDVLDDYKKL